MQKLHKKARLLRKPNERMYQLRAHSFRKFFKTQLIARGVSSDYVDYMMGHTVDTYHDIQSLGIENFARPKRTQTSRSEQAPSSATSS